MRTLEALSRKDGIYGERWRAHGEIPTLGVGLLGYAFMGKAHTNAFKTLDYIYYSATSASRARRHRRARSQQVEAAARRYGYAKGVTDWHDIVEDPAIQVFDNCAPNKLHFEPTMAAIQAGKHVLCEKPLGMDAAESKQMWQAAQAAGIVHMCGFNYRFVPAIRLMRQIIQEGRLGRIYHFRARYLQDWLADPDFRMTWRLDVDQAGTGAIGDLGTHIIDLARFLVGEPTTISANTTTFIDEREAPQGGEAARHGGRRLRCHRHLRQRRDRHAGGVALRPWAPQPQLPSRSTARKARSPSTWSA